MKYRKDISKVIALSMAFTSLTACKPEEDDDKIFEHAYCASAEEMNSSGKFKIAVNNQGCISSFNESTIYTNPERRVEILIEPFGIFEGFLAEAASREKEAIAMAKTLNKQSTDPAKFVTATYSFTLESSCNNKKEGEKEEERKTDKKESLKTYYVQKEGDNLKVVLVTQEVGEYTFCIRHDTSLLRAATNAVDPDTKKPLFPHEALITSQKFTIDSVESDD